MQQYRDSYSPACAALGLSVTIRARGAQRQWEAVTKPPRLGLATHINPGCSWYGMWVVPVTVLSSAKASFVPVGVLVYWHLVMHLKRRVAGALLVHNSSLFVMGPVYGKAKPPSASIWVYGVCRRNEDARYVNHVILRGKAVHRSRVLACCIRRRIRVRATRSAYVALKPLRVFMRNPSLQLDWG